jgi:hypothetical protein
MESQKSVYEETLAQLCRQAEAEQDLERLLELASKIQPMVVARSRKTLAVRDDRVVVGPVCPRCTSTETRTSRSRHLFERSVLRLFNFRPYRCIRCDKRFYSKSESLTA